MAEVTKKVLVKHIRALNKLSLTDKVKTKGDLDDLMEDFITAIEDIDDDGKIGKVSDDVLDFYEAQLPPEGKGDDGADAGDDGEFDAEELEEELDEMSLKQLRVFVKDNDLEDIGRITNKTKDDAIEKIIEAMEVKAEDGGDDGGEEFDADAYAEELEDMSLKDLRKLAKEKGIKTRVNAKSREDVEEALLLLAEEGGDGDDGSDDEKDLEDMDDKELLAFVEDNDITLTKRQAGFKGAKLLRIVKKKAGTVEKKADKSKDKKADSGGDYPKGIRKDTLPAQFYDAITEDEDGCTIKDMAKPLAKKKGKEPHQMYGVVMRNLIRKVAKCVDVTLTTASSGEDGDVVVTIVED